MVRGITCAVHGKRHTQLLAWSTHWGTHGPFVLHSFSLSSFGTRQGRWDGIKETLAVGFLLLLDGLMVPFVSFLWVHPQKLRVENVVHHRVALDMEQRGGLSSPSVIPTTSSPSSCFLNAYLEESSCCCAYWFATAGWFLMGIRLCSLWNSFVNLGVLLVAPVHFLYSPLQNLFPPVLNVHYP